MKRYLSFLALPVVLLGCDAMTAHTGVVARVAQHELGVEELAEMLAVNPNIPPQAEVVETVANLWVDYTMVARLLARDTTLADLDLGPMVEPYVEQRLFADLREQVLTIDTVVPEAELQEAFAEQAPGQRVRARHILLSYPQDADEAAMDSVRELAEELQERVTGDGDFAALARQHSEDPGSARQGGDLGWFERGRMVQPFEDAAFSLQPGEVSDVVETPFGLHIIKVEERETPTWDVERGEQFRQRLVTERRQAALTDYVDSLRDPVNLRVEQNAPEVARELAQDPGGRLSGRAASRRLVSWDGGSLTTREFVSVIRRLPPPQQSQYANLQEEQMENVLRELATNELVLADARRRGISVPEAEQDSIRDLIRSELTSMARVAGLMGPAQEGETEAQAIDRRVRALLEGVLAGRGNLLQLGALPYVMRDRMDWQIYESSFPKVVDELEERRATRSGAQPMPPGDPMPQGEEGTGQGQTPQPSPPDTTG